MSTAPATDLHVVAVFWKVRPEFRDAYRKAILENAAASLELEPGCLTFDVCEDPETGAFFLYELYESREAFAKHLTMEHFRKFDALVRDWVVAKHVHRFERLVNPA